MTATLTAQLADGLDSAFPELLDAHGAMVMTLATRLTDPTTAQDITQEVFLRAYRALSGYTDQRILALNLRPWLATITRNLVRNEYRRRERKGTEPLHDGQAMAAPGDDLTRIESLDGLNDLLATLPDAHREAVVLRHVVGLSLNEVALTMACPKGTAKSYVSRGLKQLRDSMSPSSDSPDSLDALDAPDAHGETR